MPQRFLSSEAFLKMATKLGRLGAWSVELPGFELTWSEEVRAIHEVGPDFVPTVEAALSFYTSEARPILESAFQTLVQEGTSFDLEVQLRSARGRTLWVRSIGEAQRNSQGEVVRVQGAFQDVTETKLARDRELEAGQQLIDVLESTHDAFFTVDLSWCFTYVNKEAERLLRLGRRELLGKGIWEVFPEARGSTFEREYLQVVASQTPREFEEYYRPLEVWLRVRAVPTPTGLAVYFQDITQQRRARTALESSERRFRELAENINDVFYSIDHRLPEIIYISPAYSKIWGRSCESLYQDPLSYLDAVLPEDRSQAEAVLQLQAQKIPTKAEYRIRRPDGSIRWVQDRTFPVLDEAGELERTVGTARDITESKNVEAEMKAGKERFQLLSKATNDAIWDWDLKSDSLWWNEGFETLFGYRRDQFELTLEGWTERIHADDRERVKQEMWAVIKGQAEHWTGRYRFLRADESVAFVVDRGYVMRDDQGRAIRMIGGMTDFTQRKEREMRLAEQAALLDRTSDAIMAFDIEGKLLFWNRGAETVYGSSSGDVLGADVAQAIGLEKPLFSGPEREVLRNDEWLGELTYKSNSGRDINIMARWSLVRDRDGEPKSVLAIHTDITEQKRLEQQFLRAQRLESIGTLAGGLAHDLNNLLAPILLSVDVLKDFVSDQEGWGVLETVRTSAERGAQLIKRVLGFARGIEGVRVLLNPSHLVEELNQVVRDTFPRNINLRLLTPADIWPIHADATQLHQVLLNLCVNARDAMPRGGNLTVSLENAVVDDVFAGMHIDSRPGPYVVIRVEDTGSGMSEAVQSRIFEPFFTTKGTGEGTGLGLATTFSIVRGHGGFIHLYSEPGKGSKFRVYFPAQAGAVVEEKVAVAQTRLPQGKGELILLVDDEEDVREITSKALERFGYRVILAANGAEAVSLYVQQKSEIALVLTDMSMPIMDGPATILALRTIDPRVRIVGSSGLPVNGDAAKVAGAGLDFFVAKPYTAEKLLTVLREALGDAGVASLPPCRPLAREGNLPAQERVSEAVGQGESILVVDDLPSLALLAKRVLERSGFQVQTANSAEEALRLLELCKGEVDLLVTDQEMPGISGRALVQKVGELYPEIKILFISGGNLSKTQEEGYTVLPKPFAPLDLISSVRSLLDKD